MLYFQYDLTITLWASFLITMAGVLDSADGQLARMSNQSTELGRIIDGAIDNAVFVVAYIAGCTYFYQGDYGWQIYLLGVPAGLIGHSYSSAVYELYKTEYLYYVTQADYAKIASLDEIKQKLKEHKGINKLLFWMYYDYTKKQHWLSTRTPEMRATFEKYAFNPNTKEKFANMYREMIKPTMIWWALVGGTNVHRTLLMVFSIFGRFDLYLVVVLLKMIPFLIVSQLQKARDEKLLEQLEDNCSSKPSQQLIQSRLLETA